MQNAKVTKIVMVASWTPTPENIGPSANMFHLMKNLPDNCELYLYTLNNNHLSESDCIKYSTMLNAKEFKIIPLTLRNYLHTRSQFADFRIRMGIDHSYIEGNYRLSSKYVDEINRINPDLVFLYGGSYVNIARQLQHHRLLICYWDCFVLHYQRMLSDPYMYRSLKDVGSTLKNIKWAIFREQEYHNINCLTYMVGMDDVKTSRVVRNNHGDVVFYPHPHYTPYPKEILLNAKKLKIIVTGKYDVYTYGKANEMRDALCSCTDLCDRYEITFVGKGWDSIVNDLKKSGYNVVYHTWVEDYGKELVKHDIQIFPISVGSGTKGKVLDALVDGILVLGTKIALENIYVKHGHSCVQYETKEELITELNNIYINREKHRLIAENGRNQVLRWHNPKRIINIMLRDVLNIEKYNGILEYRNVIGNL